MEVVKFIEDGTNNMWKTLIKERELKPMIELNTPISEEAIASLQVGDTITISGYILCGRDAVLPKVLKMIEDGTADSLGMGLHGQVIFHTAVSPAGVGPTSSNKLEIESSIAPQIGRAHV